MNVRTVKLTEPRIEYPNITNLGIIAYGYNNLYPQEIKSIVACSESGTTCLNRYVQFIQGNGFENIAFAETAINRQGDTADDILQSLADDLGSWGGFAFHVNYNLLGQIVEISHIPFENCRLVEEDDAGYSAKIAVFPDWTGKRKRNGKQLKPTKESIDYLDRFNPNNAVVLAQIEKAGGIESYKGQVFWFSSSGKQEYPKAIYDSVVTQMSTEEGLGNIAYRNTRNNFTPAGMLITKKGQDIPDGGDDMDFDENGIAMAVANVQGDLESNKIMHFEIEFNEDEPKFVNFQGANYDKDFTVTSDTACEKIYAAFSQEVWHRLRKGTVGFSSDIVQNAYDVYSSVTGIERRTIERAFDKVFKHWHQEIPTNDFTIQPLKYVSSNISSQVVSPDDTGGGKSLAVELGVGGTQALMEVLNSHFGSERKKSILKILFGLSDNDINKLVSNEASYNK